MILAKDNIQLRALEPEDLDFLFKIENNPSFWEVSGTKKPFSKYILKQYIANSHMDIYEAKQLRLVIENKQKVIGLIDLFNFEPQHQRAGIGILINSEFQYKGFASIALELLLEYSFSVLQLHQVYANIQTTNTASIKLFTKAGFELVGIKKQWNKTPNSYQDIALYQLINKK